MSTLREQILSGNHKKDDERRATDGTIIVQEDYTLKDIEEYIVDKLYDGKLKFLEKNVVKLAKLISRKQKDEYDFCSNEYIRKRDFLEIFLHYYLNNVEPFIFIKTITDKIYFPYKTFEEMYANPNGKYVMIKPSHGKRFIIENNSIICKKEDVVKIIKEYRNSEKNEKIWDVIAGKYFENAIKEVNKLLCSITISELPYSYGISLNTHRGAEIIHIYNEMKSKCKDRLEDIKREKNLSNLFMVPSSNHPLIIMIRGNYICVVNCYKEGAVIKLSNPQYGVLCKYDTVISRTGDGQSFSVDTTISPVYLKKKSVMGNAVLGTIIGGTVGGFVGATLANYENKKRQEKITSYTPLMVNIQFPENTIDIEFTKTKNHMYITLNTALYSRDEVKQLLTAIFDAQSDNACLEGELIKEFILDSNVNALYTEDAFSIYSKKKQESLINEYFENDSNIAKIIDMEKDFDSKLNNMDEDYKNNLCDLEQEYNVKINDYKESAREIQNAISGLGIFKGKEKKRLTAELDEVEKKIDSLDTEHKQTVVNLKTKFQKKREPIEAQKDEVMLIKKSLLYNIGILEAENRLY